MTLLANAVRLPQPCRYRTIQLLGRTQAERVDVVAGRDIFDLRETRIFQASGQHDMTNDSISSEAHRGKTHPNLKRNACFFRDDPHRSAPLHEFCELPEQCDRVWAFAGEMFP